ISSETKMKKSMPRPLDRIPTVLDIDMFEDKDVVTVLDNKDDDIVVIQKDDKRIRKEATKSTDNNSSPLKVITLFSDDDDKGDGKDTFGTYKERKRGFSPSPSSNLIELSPN